LKNADHQAEPASHGQRGIEYRQSNRDRQSLDDAPLPEIIMITAAAAA